jgi:lipoprotein-releasing system permease protein
MFRPLELFIGLRYTRAKRRNHFISFISLISILGISLGITVLITVLSVMNGFEKELRERILQMTSHATISGLDGRLENWPSLAQHLKSNREILDSAPYVQGQAMLVNGRDVSGALIRGVDPNLEQHVAEVAEHMEAGHWDGLEAGAYHIVIGSELAETLGARLGDKITLITPQATVTPAGVLPRLRRFEIVGVFKVGMSEYDRSVAFIHIEDAAKLFETGTAVSGLRLKLRDLLKAPFVAKRLETELQGRYWISDWTQQNANFFRAVAIEKTMMFIILMLIVAVAAFNIVSTLVMVVTDKQADIAILRTLGLTPGRVMGVFMVQGSTIGIFGTLLGVTGGVLLALNLQEMVQWLEHLLGIKFLSPDVYYISELPSDLQIRDVVRIAALALSLSFAATIYPAWRASRTQPAEALRYE